MGRIVDNIGEMAGSIITNARAGGKAAANGIDSFADEIAEKVSGNIIKGRMAKAIGAGTEGMLLGSAAGGVIGGISGAIDEDESFIGGYAKGMLIGGGLGLTGGAASGAIHNNAHLISNGVNDARAVASQIAKWTAKQGDGISESMASAQL